MIWLSIGLLWMGATGWLYWLEERHPTRSTTGSTTDGSTHGATHGNGSGKRSAPRIVAARDLLAGGILFWLTLGFFWRTVSGDVYQPADGGDLVSFLFPTYRFAAAQLQQGTLPLWNPTLYAGAPFIGDIQAGFLYIPNLLLFTLRPHFDYPMMQWLTIGHLYWAGLGMYLLLRVIGRGPAASAATSRRYQLSRPAALFGAIAFQYSDPLLLHLGNLNLIAVLSWLPWILAAYRQALVWHSLRWAGIAGFLFAFANFAGHAQSTFYIALALALYTLAHWAQRGANWLRTERWRESRLPQLVAVVQYPLLTATLTILLTAPILLPAFELARFTERSTFTYQDTVAYSLAPTQAIGLLTPAFFGRGPALHWSLWSRVETPYAGVATLILAVAAFLLANAARRRQLWGWFWIAAVGFVTALGVYAIVHGWLTFALPLFDQFRAPARALVLWTFGIAVLAAHGVDALQQQSSLEQTTTAATTASGPALLQRLLRAGAMVLAGIALPLCYLALLLTQENELAFLRASVAALALTLAAAFWLATWALVSMAQARWLRATTLGMLLFALLYFDLATTGAYSDISPTDPTVGYAHEEIVQFLRNEPELGRIDTRTDIQAHWQPDSAALFGLEDVGGIANPLMLAQWQMLWEGLGGRQSKLYDMLHVTHVVVADGTPLPGEKFSLAFDAPGPLALYRNQDAYPRAWLVHDAQMAADPAAALAQLQQPAFDPAQVAIIDDSHTDKPPDLRPATAPESVRVERHSTNQIELTVQASAPALLLLSEQWYPGWRATVNGATAPLLRANVALRAVPVPAGTSSVSVTFVPDGWRAGLLSAVAGWILLLFVFLFEKRDR